MEFEMIKEAIPTKKMPRGEISSAIHEWLASENKTLVIRCKSDEELKRVSVGCYSYRKNKKEDFTIFKKDASTICLVKA